MVLSWKRRQELEVRCASLERECAALQRENDVIRSEYERLRADYQTVVGMLGNMASRPAGKTLFDDDPFKEDKRQLNTYLSPSPDEAGIDYDGLMEQVATHGDADGEREAY